MSLPPAQKVRSENPGKNTVAAPSDPQAIEQDVARKLRIYAMVQALRRGRLPSNGQLDDALVVLRDKLTQRTSKAESKENTIPLSDEGRTVVLDVRDIVETSRQLLRQKNTDEVLQDLIYHTSGIHLSAPGPGVELPVSIDKARKDGETAVHHLRTLIRLLLTNREARKLLNDSKLILRDLFAHTAVAAAERARPSAKEMEGLDDAAPGQDWAGNTDDGEEDEEDAAVKAAVEHRAGNGHQNGNDQGSPRVEGELDVTKPELGERKTDAESPEPSEVVTNGDSADQKKPLRLNLKDRFRSMAGRVPEKHRTRAEQEYTGAKKYLEEEFPQERRDQFVWRLKKVVTECQTTDSYQASISWFLTIVHAYFSNARALATSHASQTNDLFAGDPILSRAVSELRIIAERGAGGRSLDGILDAIDVLWNDAKEDAEMRKWWENVEVFMRKTLLQPGYITSTQFTSQSRKLRTSGRFFFTQKYKTHTDALVDAAQAWSRAWLGDPLHVRLSDNWGKLVRDLLFDEKGGLMFKSHLWKDMRTVILPGLVRRIGVIPIPRIEYVDDDLDLVIENLTLQGTNLFPKVIEVKAQHYSKLSPFASIKDEHRNSLTLTLRGIQTDMRDVAFYYRKKRGFGKIRDEGLADVYVGGRGITVKLKLTSASASGHGDSTKSVFTVKHIDVKVEELKFAIRESKHDFLYKTLRPVATRLIKRQIAKVFSDGLRTALGYLDEQLAAARDGMAEAKASEDGSRREVLKELWHKQASEISSIKSKRDSAFRVVPKHESMLLPDKGHKKGWIRRQAEKDAEAAESDGWRSEAFNMASVPKAT